jgi:hypothetical protein
MDLRVFIIWRASDTFDVTVVALDVGRGWHKIYSSQKECMDDLCRTGLLTLVERYDALRIDFSKEWVLITRANADAEALESAGFVDATPKS